MEVCSVYVLRSDGVLELYATQWREQKSLEVPLAPHVLLSACQSVQKAGDLPAFSGLMCLVVQFVVLKGIDGQALGFNGADGLYQCSGC